MVKRHDDTVTVRVEAAVMSVYCIASDAADNSVYLLTALALAALALPALPLLLLMLHCVSADQSPSIDAVIVGGFYGTGFEGHARSGMFTSFLMAIRSGSKEDVDTDEKCMVYTCGKVGSGVDTAELQVCLCYSCTSQCALVCVCCTA
jgi:hypothetical protein